MRDEELRLLALREADAAKNSRQAKLFSIAGILLGLVATVAAGWSVSRHNARRGLAESALRESERRYRG